MEEKLIYTLAELKEQTGFSSYQIRKYREQGKLRALPNRRPASFTKTEVDNWMGILQKEAENNEDLT